MYKHYSRSQNAFTIVELLIVIVIIAILAAITVVAYNGVQARAVKTALQSDLRNAATKVALSKAESGKYPTTQEEAVALFTPAPGTHYEYSTPDGGATYLMTITSDKAGAPAYCQKSDGSLTEGACPGHSATPPAPMADGTVIQTITNTNCPSARTRAVDARDNHTYWVQKLADGKCWMLTNLAYGGGGTNTYNDIKTITSYTGSFSLGSPYTAYTQARYFVYTSANPTTEPTNPSTSTDGGSTNPQYGYHYNWCAAMGAQTGTSACSNQLTPAYNSNVSICPAGWRIPTGGAGGEVQTLNNVINGGSTTTDTELRNTWLMQKAGYRYTDKFWNYDSEATYWTSTQWTAGSYAYVLRSANNQVTAGTDAYAKANGYPVRCLAI